MKTMLKGIGTAAIAIAAALALSALYVYFAAQEVIDRRYDVPFAFIRAQGNPGSIERGRHLAAISGCLHCHGTNLQGTELFHEPGIATINAPNLTRATKDYTDLELERVIRHGVKKDGTSTWIMPSQMFSFLSDENLRDIVAFVRSMPERDGPMASTHIGLIGRLGIITGRFTPVAAQVAARDEVPGSSDLRSMSDPFVTLDEPGPKFAEAPSTVDDSIARGRYLVMTSCTECHGVNLEGTDFVKAPSLLASAAYDEAAFTRLMRTGVKLGNRSTGMMSETSRARFANFTEEEIRSVYVFLKKWVDERRSVSGKVAASPN